MHKRALACPICLPVYWQSPAWLAHLHSVVPPILPLLTLRSRHPTCHTLAHGAHACGGLHALMRHPGILKCWRFIALQRDLSVRPEIGACSGCRSLLQPRRKIAQRRQRALSLKLGFQAGRWPRRSWQQAPLLRKPLGLGEGPESQRIVVHRGHAPSRRLDRLPRDGRGLAHLRHGRGRGSRVWLTRHLEQSVPKTFMPTHPLGTRRPFTQG